MHEDRRDMAGGGFDGCGHISGGQLSASGDAAAHGGRVFSVCVYQSGSVGAKPQTGRGRLLAALISTVLLEGIVFWNGILRVCCTSVQLGIKWRVLGVVCGWIPFLNLFMLSKIIRPASACLAMNEIVKDSPGVYYQSVGSKLNKAADGQFPLDFSYKLVKYFDGPNDGLVADESFPWGSRYQMLVTAGERGISHGDMVDLNRENLMDFDVREFYVQLVSRLRRMGF